MCVCVCVCVCVCFERKKQKKTKNKEEEEKKKKVVLGVFFEAAVEFRAYRQHFGLPMEISPTHSCLSEEHHIDL